MLGLCAGGDQRLDLVSRGCARSCGSANLDPVAAQIFPPNHSEDHCLTDANEVLLRGKGRERTASLGPRHGRWDTLQPGHLPNASIQAVRLPSQPINDTTHARTQIGSYASSSDRKLDAFRTRWVPPMMIRRPRLQLIFATNLAAQHLPDSAGQNQGGESTSSRRVYCEINSICPGRQVLSNHGSKGP